MKYSSKLPAMNNKSCKDCAVPVEERPEACDRGCLVAILVDYKTHDEFYR